MLAGRGGKGVRWAMARRREGKERRRNGLREGKRKGNGGLVMGLEPKIRKRVFPFIIQGD
jgi:hypothetical protein